MLPDGLQRQCSHCPKMDMNEENPSKFQFYLPVLLVPCPMEKINFQKKILGYFIIYLSIWSFMSHGCFTARSMLKCKENRELRVLFKTAQDQIREN